MKSSSLPSSSPYKIAVSDKNLPTPKFCTFATTIAALFSNEASGGEIARGGHFVRSISNKSVASAIESARSAPKFATTGPWVRPCRDRMRLKLIQRRRRISGLRVWRFFFSPDCEVGKGGGFFKKRKYKK